MRQSEIERKTLETKIKLKIDLDGSGANHIDTGVGFLDHMLTLFAVHSGYDLDIKCTGDTEVDDHHSVEDIGIALGEAVKEALGDRRGIVRYGSQWLPMDEALVLCAVDVSGRSCLRYDLSIPSEKVGSFDTELVEEFFTGFTRKAELCLHIRQFDGTNSHHIIEAAFKGFGRALSQATAINSKNPNEIPSSKGVL